MISDPDLAKRFQSIEGLNFEGWTTAAKFREEDYEPIEVDNGQMMMVGLLFAKIAQDVGVSSGFDSAAVRLKGTGARKLLVFHPVTGSVFIFSDDKAVAPSNIVPATLSDELSPLALAAWAGIASLAGLYTARMLGFKREKPLAAIGAGLGVVGYALAKRKGLF